MAISLSRKTKTAQKQVTGRKMAREYERQQAREKSRGFFSNILGTAGGKLLGAGLTSFFSLTGIGAPIGMALGNLLAKKGAHELTKGMGMGADPSKIKGDKYGFGEQEAKTISEGLREQSEASDPFQAGGFGKELLSSYLTAGAAGELKGAFKNFGKEGSFIKAGGPKTLGERWKAGLEGMGKQWDDVTTFGGEKEDAIPEGKDFAWQQQGVDPQSLPVTQEYLTEDNLWAETDPFGGTTDQYGNLVSEETYKGGGVVPQKSPTIANYFNMQGVSLGGSHMQSVAEMLGRK